jgi:hypothetical protein
VTDCNVELALYIVLNGQSGTLRLRTQAQGTAARVERALTSSRLRRAVVGASLQATTESVVSVASRSTMGFVTAGLGPVQNVIFSWSSQAIVSGQSSSNTSV